MGYVIHRLQLVCELGQTTKKIVVKEQEHACVTKGSYLGEEAKVDFKFGCDNFLPTL